ncbi:amino acid permease [Haloarcula nitratireducens]|uniref:Amino acid permease n=1 Tax=Haloarcula nitratireducens TaxID=2487749 RepID=A0AAW4PAK7_9EURY|nr:amino acid permease [Halomicroarcula nitratireducens]MBX0294931.1 amino acid permease [Halomicroarcula nitratireducens]
MVEHTRTLDFKIAFAIGLGTMIAAGIFSLSGTAVAAIGSSAVIAFVIAALIAGVTAAAYSEFASIYSENGGGYLFCSRTFEDRDLLTYAIGMSLFLGYTGTTAFYLATMDEWFFEFVLPQWLHFLPHGTTGVLAALLLGALNAQGTEESGGFQLVVTGAKVAVLLAFIGGAFAFRGPSTAVGNFAANFGGGPIDVLTISALAFITFFGFSAIAASAGEIIEPQKTVPRAIAASMVTVTVLYALVIIAMVNSPVPAEVIARQGETAMGEVAAGFLGPIGRSLIVAGAIFSMVSASNASILAASSIGSLMGRQGQAPRRFSRIHQKYGTPFWSVVTATGVIVALIVLFIAVFPAEGGPLPFDLTISLPLLGSLALTDLGLEALTGFATLNLLMPLAVVNVALIYSRRKLPDIARGFEVPGVPVVPVVGVLANIGLIYNLPRIGVVVGLVLTAALVVAYVLWGGAPETEDLLREVVPESEPSAAPNGADDAEGDVFRVLIPVARPDRALRYVRLAGALAAVSDKRPLIHVLNVTQVPDQTPWETVQDTARGRTERIQNELDSSDVGVDYTVEGHTCRDVAFDIVQTARDDRADLILMGYPERHQDVTETVEREAPCDVFFADPTVSAEDLDVINIGAGGGPHHQALLPLVNALGQRGSELHLINVSSGEPGAAETPGATLDALEGVERTEVHNVTASSVAGGLVETAAENGGVLVIGASRDRWLRQALFGNTPDEVLALAAEMDVPVLVYASETGVSDRVSERLFPVVRYVRKRLPLTGSKQSGSLNRS